MSFEVYERTSRQPAKRRRHAVHGTRSMYNKGCRCIACTEAHRVYCMALRRKLNARLLDDPTVVAHGSSSTYGNWGCRCDDCTEANAIALQAWKNRTGYNSRRAKR